MTTIIIFILVLIIIDCILGIVNSFRVHKLKRSYDTTISDFLYIYKRFQDVWDTDYDAEKILEICNLENNFLRFGVVDLLSYKDARELRSNMLMVGEFIIKFSDSMRCYYDYCGNDEKFKEALDALREIRRICIRKGEKTSYGFQ